MLRTAAGRVRIGISGFSYPPWRGVFYPPQLRQKDELRFASEVFPTIELNGSFYSLQRPQSYQAWYAATPPDFVFAVKGGRFVTHMKRLRNAETALANFFASGLLCLGEKLGPILWQLPPSMRFDAAVLEPFFELLPRTTREVEQLARRHDARLDGRSVVDACHDARIRYTLEVRHPSFQDRRYEDLLKSYGIASCVADSAGLYPQIDVPSTSFSYARLHGAKELYVSGYSPRDLAPWAERVQRWAKRGDVFVYFDNDVKVRAPFDALNLARIANGESPQRIPRSLSGVTEEARTEWAAWRRDRTG